MHQKIYTNRKIIVESILGQIKTGSLDAFSLKGIKKQMGSFFLFVRFRILIRF